VGNTGGFSNPGMANMASNTVSFPYTGDLTLHTVDFTNPVSGTILSTLVTPYQSTARSSTTSLGSGFFSITIAPPLTDLLGPTMLAIVDARNTSSLVVYPEYGIDGLLGTTLSNGYLYTVSNAGLTVYSVTLP
jgi:hypothetical protein